MKKKKKTVTNKLACIDPDTITSGLLLDIVTRLKNLSDSYTKDGYTNVVLDPDVGYEGEIQDIYLYGDRIETDEEYAERLAHNRAVEANQQAEKEKQRQVELQLYHKLKAKFEPIQ